MLCLFSCTSLHCRLEHIIHPPGSSREFVRAGAELDISFRKDISTLQKPQKGSQTSALIGVARYGHNTMFLETDLKETDKIPVFAGIPFAVKRFHSVHFCLGP